MSRLLGLGNAVEGAPEAHVSRRLLGFRQALQVVAGARDKALVVLGYLTVARGKMNAQEAKLLVEIKVVVCDDTAMELLRNQREQPLTIHWFRVGFPKMELIQAFLEQRCENLVFLHKKIRARQ